MSKMGRWYVPCRAGLLAKVVAGGPTRAPSRRSTSSRFSRWQPEGATWAIVAAHPHPVTVPVAAGARPRAGDPETPPSHVLGASARQVFRIGIGDLVVLLADPVDR